MQCTCVRQTDLPNTSKLYADLIYHFDRVKDFYPFPPNNLESVEQAAKFTFPDARRAALVEALTPLNEANPSLQALVSKLACSSARHIRFTRLLPPSASPMN
jgi:hypothetical protein